jgi:hypothetical protein
MLELDEPDPVLDNGASFGDVAFLISSAQTMVAWMPALSRQGVNLCGADLAAARPRHRRRAALQAARHPHGGQTGATAPRLVIDERALTAWRRSRRVLVKTRS